MRAAAIILSTLILGAAPAAAQDVPMEQRTEKLSLKPHRVKGKLLGFGYSVGEFTGEASGMNSSSKMPLFSSNKARTTFTFSNAGAAPVTAECAGGQSRLGLGWIDFKRSDLQYVCTFQGGPRDAAFALVLSEAGLGSSLYQPQRAAEIVWNGRSLRAVTRRVAGAMPLSGGQAISYRIIQGNRDVAGYSRGAIAPTFYLPPKGDPNREAAALMALTLFFFQDPGNQR